MEFELYYDYLCPFVYRASLLLANVAAERPIDVQWRYFSLAQVNTKEEGWTVWAAPAAEQVRGRLAFKAAEAARRQDRFDPFHANLLGARHQDRLDIDDAKVVEQVAEESGLDLERFRHDLDDPAILDALARDHKQGFCFGDRHPVTRTAKPHFRAGDCGLFKPRLFSVREGTSVGFVDIYPAEFHGQWIDITGIRDGHYVLVHEVNPEFALRERSYTNNEASVLIDLRGDGVRVLKRCPRSGKCG